MQELRSVIKDSVCSFMIFLTAYLLGFYQVVGLFVSAAIMRLVEEITRQKEV